MADVKDFVKGNEKMTFRTGTKEVLQAFNIKEALEQSLGMPLPSEFAKANEPDQR